MDKVNKITYGLKNVYYALIETEDEVDTVYAGPVHMPGGASISFSKNVNKTPIPADDDPEYAEIVDDKGYNGNLVLYDVPDSYLTDCLGMTLENGVIIENKNDKTNPFALLFEFDGDKLQKRHVFYRCVGEKPDVASQTKGDGTTANQVTLNMSATPTKDTGDIKATCPSGATAYKTWFEVVKTKKLIKEGTANS